MLHNGICEAKSGNAIFAGRIAYNFVAEALSLVSNQAPTPHRRRCCFVEVYGPLRIFLSNPTWTHRRKCVRFRESPLNRQSAQTGYKIFSLLRLHIFGIFNFNFIADNNVFSFIRSKLFELTFAVYQSSIYTCVCECVLFFSFFLQPSARMKNGSHLSTKCASQVLLVLSFNVDETLCR